MRELTNELPKPMLKVNGSPILEHILQGLVNNGIQEVFVVTGFRAEVIERHEEVGSEDVGLSFDIDTAALEYVLGAAVDAVVEHLTVQQPMGHFVGYGIGSSAG